MRLKTFITAAITVPFLIANANALAVLRTKDFNLEKGLLQME